MRPTLAAATLLSLVAVGCGGGTPKPPVTPRPGPGAARKTVTLPEGKAEVAKALKATPLFNVARPEGDNTPARLLASGDGKRLVATVGGPADAGAKSECWDVSAKPAKSRELAGYALAVSPDGKRVVFRKADGSAYLADADGKAEPVAVAKGVAAEAAAFDGKDKVVVAGRANGTGRVAVIDAAGKEASAFDVPAGPKARFLLGAAATGVVVVLDGKKAEVWSLADKKVTRTATAAAEAVPGKLRAEVSADGKRVLADDELGIMVFDATSGEVVWCLEDDNVAFLVPGRDQIALRRTVIPQTGVSKPGFSLFDLAADSFIVFLPGKAFDLAFSGDGNSAFTWDGAGAVVRFDLGGLKK